MYEANPHRYLPVPVCQIAAILRQQWCWVQASCNILKLYVMSGVAMPSPTPPVVVFRRPRNLRDLLIRARVTTPAHPTNTGNAPCNSRRKCCAEMDTCDSFRSKSTGRQYNIRHITYKSRNLVHLISCRCGLHYVGEMEKALHTRINGHRSEIRTKKVEKPVAAHFCQPDHSPCRRPGSERHREDP